MDTGSVFLFISTSLGMMLLWFGIDMERDRPFSNYWPFTAVSYPVSTLLVSAYNYLGGKEAAFWFPIGIAIASVITGIAYLLSFWKKKNEM